MQCDMSHDIDIILNYEQQKKAMKKKRKRNRKSKQSTSSSQECAEDAADVENFETNGSGIVDAEVAPDETPSHEPEQALVTTSSTNTASGNHRAGFDAFMTGFSMATYYHRFKTQGATTFAESINAFINKLNLSAKDIPLKVEKSQFCKTSVNHNEMWKKVMSTT